MKKCTRCGVEKSVSEFGVQSRRPDGLNPWCKVCKREHDNSTYKSSPTRKQYITANRERARRSNVETIYNYLKTHPCVDCGESDPVVLDFDHIDRTTKRKAVGSLTDLSLRAIMEEIGKCEVRCANCHRRRTAIQFGWYSYFLPS